MSVFNSSTSTPTVVKAGKATVIIGDDTYLALNVTIQFQRQVDVVPTIGKERVISVGEPVGTIQAEKVFGDGTLAELLRSCDPTGAEIEIEPECDGPRGSILCYGLILSAVTLTAQGGRGYVAVQVTGTFTGLDIS